MLVELSQPVGIDKAIKNLQQLLHDKLMKSWGLNVNDASQNGRYKCYPRCYRNATDDGFIAEVYEGNKQYKEVYFDDSIYAISFFGISDSQIRVSEQNTADVHFVMFANLEKLYPDATHRADEELRSKVCELLGAGTLSSDITGIELTITRVLKEYPGSRRDDRLKYVDMHPVHAFRINLTLSYENTTNYC